MSSKLETLLMSQRPYMHDSQNLKDIFSELGRGFYIPAYQRPYSWEEENVQQLLADIFYALDTCLEKPHHIIFLGTLILQNEADILEGTHVDETRLLTKISYVVDGPQRLTTISLLACVLHDQASTLMHQIGPTNSTPELKNLHVSLEDTQQLLLRLYSVLTDKTGSDPLHKPLMIRPVSADTKIQSDQWTLRGDISDFYTSDLASFQAKFINNPVLNTSIPQSGKIHDTLLCLSEALTQKLESIDTNILRSLETANVEALGSLKNFIDEFPDLDICESFDTEEKKLVAKSVFLIAFSHYLLHASYFVSIETSDINLALDMFQALNATGTPLTAFEVFKPKVVEAWGSSKYNTEIKSIIDRAEQTFDNDSVKKNKTEATEAVIINLALTYHGELISKKFSELRNYLFKSHGTYSGTKEKDFLAKLSDQAEYQYNIVRPKSRIGVSNPFIVSHLATLGLTPDQADMAAFCIYYLKDANHRMANTVLSVFYSRLLESGKKLKSDPTNKNLEIAKNKTASDFENICKATAAFFTLWMGGQNKTFPDQVYRSLFKQTAPNISFDSGTTNQTVKFIKEHFKSALISEGLYDAKITKAKALWVTKAKNKTWYNRLKVCKFSLMIAMHDAALDLSPGREGLLTNGNSNSVNMLGVKKWYSEDLNFVEHVATQDEPKNINFPSFFDNNVYPGNYSVVDKLGNLSLLSQKINSSLYSEWPDKTFYFWSLTQPEATVKGPTAKDLMTTLGITKIPKSLETLSAASDHLPHLAPLAHRGQKGLKWDLSFIEKRSENLAERVFETLSKWLT